MPDKDTTYWCQMFKIPVQHEKHHVTKVSDPDWANRGPQITITLQTNSCVFKISFTTYWSENKILCLSSQNGSSDSGVH